MGIGVPLRVLHVCAGNLYGGIERIVSECATSRALCAEMSPSFAVCFEGRLSQEIDASGASCVRLGPARMSRPHTVLRARESLRTLLDVSRPDAIVCHSSWATGLAGSIARRAGVPLAMWVHDRLSGGTWAERWALATRPDLLIVNSRYTAETVARVYPAVPHEVVYAPVPASTQGSRDVRVSLGVETATPVVLIASRFERWKGHHELIAALSKIEEPWCLWIAGGPQRDGEVKYERELRSLVDCAGIEARTRFLGERRDVPALMRAADVHCQPNSIAEPFGLTYVEALYAGLPVVTTAMGGALEIVTRDCGVLVPPDDPGALTMALRMLIRDPALRAQLGFAGPARAAELCDPARQLAKLATALGRAMPVGGAA